MAAHTFVTVLVLFSCVAESWQNCFSWYCPLHSVLTECLEGTYQCRADEFCETTTYSSYINHQWVTMSCRPNTELQDCQLRQSNNDPYCDPNKHDRLCHWCCRDEQCMRDLTAGVFPTGGTGPVQTTFHPSDTATTVMESTSTSTSTSMSMPMSTSTSTSASTSTSMPTSASTSTLHTSVVTGLPCKDLYLGDCALELGGRCSETFIPQLCAKTCGLCT